MQRIIVYGRATIALYAIVEVPDEVPNADAAARACALRLAMPVPTHAPYLTDEDTWQIDDAHFDEVTPTGTAPG